MKRIFANCLFTAAVWGQTYRVPLVIETGEPAGFAHGVEISYSDATHGTTAIPSGGEFAVERMPAPLNGVIVRADGLSLALLRGQQSDVYLPRAIGNLKSTGYKIWYDAYERDGQTHESLLWTPIYRAGGKLKLPGCQVNIAVFDFNADGVFDRKDWRQASTLAIDLNGDGHFREGEWHFIPEILDVCGTALQVADLDPAGASITFRVSELKPPSVGDPMPQFSVPVVSGGSMNSAAMRGSVALMDFWASWCGPCVAELDEVAALSREFSKDLKVYGVDVDEPERRAAADRIVREKAILFPQVIREQGEKDFLWKLFGSMKDNLMEIPLFVVVDREGRIRYASHGGKDLEDLKAAVREAIASGK